MLRLAFTRVVKRNQFFVDAYQFFKPSPDPEVRIFRKFLRPEDKVIDAGCNRGASSINYAECSKFVWGLEPNPKMFLRAKINTSLYKNIQLFNIGLSDRIGRQSLFTKSPDPSKAGKAGSLFLNSGNILEIEVYPLDDLALDANVLIMDIEGSEIKALQGAKKSIANFRMICMETHYLGHPEGTFAEVKQILGDHDFNLRFLSAKKEDTIESYCVFERK